MFLATKNAIYQKLELTTFCVVVRQYIHFAKSAGWFNHVTNTDTEYS